MSGVQCFDFDGSATTIDDGYGSSFGDEIEHPDLEGSVAEGDEELTRSDGVSIDDLQNFWTYVDLVWTGGVSVVQLYGNVFVVQGWDSKSALGMRSWYHLERTKIGTKTVVGCYCKRSRRDGVCVHQRFVENYGEEEFPGDKHALAGEYKPTLPKDSEASAILFLRQPGGGEKFTNYFSVSSRSGTAKSRAVVMHDGDDRGGGSWKCTKDVQDNCIHITDARRVLLRVLGLESTNGSREDMAIDLNVLDAVMTPRKLRRNNSISYLPIVPPIWAALDTDVPHYIRPNPCRQAPLLLHLDFTSTCPCGPTRTHYSPQNPIIVRDCTIYGLTEAFQSRIQVQSCSTCAGRARRFIGPEPRGLGIFNFNNRILFTHELLDDYTSVYTSSETPFTAWVTVLSRRYGANNSSAPFVTEEVFRAAWFAYVDLQDFSNDMRCKKCGPIPEDVVWDGVTVGFNKKHLLPTLRPPTVSDANNSPVRKNRYIWKQQLLNDAKLRRRLRLVVRGIPPRMDKVLDRGACLDPKDLPEQRSEAASKAEVERVTSIPQVISDLAAVNGSLAALFDQHFGLAAVYIGTTPPSVYKKLFIQLAADESVLQMLNKTALDQLASFNQQPCHAAASEMINCPVLLQVLKYHDNDEKYPASILGLCQWLHHRGSEVFGSVMSQAAQDSLHTTSIVEEDWQETGCCYSLPQIRHRPVYENLKHDIRTETSNNRGAKCSKYYAQYGAKKLTGGILAAWCTHSVCYGFHFIPKGEGRNDVFSAMYTRWEIAPKRIIYDFACALGPYCLIREPAFFAESTYGIDIFHASDHKKCAPAAFLETYMAVDPRLALVNSSAAECGNGGIKRIRKSVSYMGQARAIMYTKVFLSVWNRLRIRAFSCT
ncbi:hypothetical protein FPV67DRAFT_1429432 [Lyophyllum atratum]|nr:hypothetical protein FPV67DRAFT_1429432 [Lyophyllum atratum]